MDSLALVRWQNGSGVWFSDSYELPVAYMIFAWKCGTPNTYAEIIVDGAIEVWTK